MYRCYNRNDFLNTIPFLIRRECVMKKDKKTLAIIGIISCCMLAGCGSNTKDVKDTTSEVMSSATEDIITSTDATSATTTQDTTTTAEDTSETTTEVTTKETTTEETTEDTTAVDVTIEYETETDEAGTEIIGSIEASIVTNCYAGDVLRASDFSIKYTKEDGSVVFNPEGWSAAPLKLKEGENKITVRYKNLSTVIIFNATKKPEGVDENVTDGELGPLVSVNPDAFAVTGTSVLGQTPDMGQEYLDKIVFLGDSRTYSYKAYGVLSGGTNTTQVWTPRSGTMTLSSQSYALIYYPETGTDVSIRDAVKMKKPEYIVIGLGTNGLSYMTEEVFKAEYRSLINDIKKISPDTKIMINSIFPVANYYDRLDLINNKKIAECNQWLVEVAEETGAKYLNTAEVLVDEQGWLNINYDNGGGATHLNKQGNEIVMQYIRTHGYK